MTATRRTLITRLLRVVVIAAVVGFLLTRVDLGELRAQFSLRTVTAIALAQPILLLAFIGIAWRHALLVRQPAAPLRVAFKAVILSIGLNAVLPGRLAELIKATYLRDHAGTGFSAGVAAVLTERLVDLVIVGSIAAVAAVLAVVDVNPLIIAAIVVAGVFMLVALARADRLAARVLPWVPGETMRLFLERTLAESARHVRQGKLRATFLIGIPIWSLSFAAAAVIVLHAGAHPVSVAGLLALFVATTVGGAIPALPGGFGTYEAAAMLVLGSFGYSSAEALAIGVAMHVAQFTLPIPLSMLILSVERIGVVDLARQVMRGPAVDPG